MHLACTNDCGKRVFFGIHFYNYFDSYYLGTKTEIILVKIIVKVNSEEDTFSVIDCK
jgi:hypothetical protein